MNKKIGTAKEIKRQFIIVGALALAAMLFLIIYSTVSTFKNMSSALMSVGENSLAREKEQVNAYLQKTIGILEISAVHIENMMDEGRDNESIYRLLKHETERFATDFNENFTGIYGYFKGEFFDGADRDMGENYNPKERDWYISAIDAKGKTVISPPYVDAVTGKVIVSISKLLKDKESVVSMDVSLDEIQKITEGININNAGYGMIADVNGLVIAHSDATKIGEMLSESEHTKDIFRQIVSGEIGHFNAELKQKKAVVFYEKIINDWYVVMIVNSENLYKEVFETILRNSIICAMVFIAVIVLMFSDFHRIVASIRQVEESRKIEDNMYRTIVRTLARTIDAKDEYTKGHSQRVGIYSKEIAKRMGKTDKEIYDIYYAALLHDVGKIRIPDAIVNKKGKLDDEEFRVVKLHTVTGYHILKYVEGNSLISLGAREHHERYDGKGYPNALKGENISEVARIIAVADSYDAMTSNRSYRDAMSQDTVREQIEMGKGTQFDPDIADIMLNMIDEDKEYIMREHAKLNRTILMIDDEEEQHELLRNVIKDKPEYILKNAKSGDMAIKMLMQEDVDVILLDMQMPDMDGFETYERLKQHTNAQFVFLTEESTREGIEKAYAMGISDYLVKPFNTLAILEVLHSLFQDDLE